jgi:2-polyprenyl-3-methyl-5-hydroxy-6-metoxy-1,4-benzoquinol methylase
MYLTYNVKEYFDKIYNFQNKSVLDFGCNHGNFLSGENNFSSYTGLDINKNIIEKNKIQFSQHKWIYYPNYNWQYNNNINTATEWPVLDFYDVTVAFSVFTHTDFNEFKNTLKKLNNHTRTILSSFMSTTNVELIKLILEHRPEYFNHYINELVDKIYNKNNISLIVSKNNNQIHVLENMLELPKTNNSIYMLTFYNDDWLQEQLQGEIFDITDNFEGILGTQKCLKLSTPL